MRSRKLLAAAAGSLLVLGPSTALAAGHASQTGRCRIGINLAPRVIEAGESTVIFGRLRCPAGSSTANRSVHLFERSVGVPGARVARGTTTDAHGFYEFVRRGVEFNSAFYVASAGARSLTANLRVFAHVSLSGPPEGSQLLTGRANGVTFTGVVSPLDAGARVVLQRQNANSGDDWRRIDVGFVGAAGTYSITHTFAVPGDANIRVLVHSQRRNVSSPSPVLGYEIVQAQNPQLTINASSDPITFSQHVSITGTVAGAPNAIVTLLAHTAAQPSFVVVAEAKTDASGNYAFPAQVPAQSTFCQVRSAGRLSAILFEGVKDLLTAQVSSGTIKAGQTVTFSGSVAPDHTGHVIYLERRNAIGSDFHVVQVATVGSGSTYAIEHAVYDTGVKLFRVRIPGGPENEGAASAPFAVSVSRAAARTLKPEPPANSTVPSEGEQ
jgi:hypothetical protein